MFKRLGRALSAKSRSKVRLDVQIVSLQGVAPSVASCRVIWARDAKVQMTSLKIVENGEWTASSAGRVCLPIQLPATPPSRN